MGVVSGDILVDGEERDDSFQRKTGYCMQQVNAYDGLFIVRDANLRRLPQDVHLATSSVREALEFSALLRQPRHIPKADKLAYVDEVLKLLEMEAYQHAVVGDLGEGASQQYEMLSTTSCD